MIAEIPAVCLSTPRLQPSLQWSPLWACSLRSTFTPR